MNQIQVKTILNKKKYADSWFLDRFTLNPYSSCSFNCLYCYIRGSKYGTNMERKLAVKTNAPELLEKQLKRLAQKNDYGFIVLASATDPYLSVEKDEKITRRLIEIILKYRFPLHIITKSDLVLRDLDLFEELRKEAIIPPDLSNRLKEGVVITFSFSTIDEKIARIFEPGAPKPQARLDALKHIRSHGFHSGISMMPMIPYISDRGEHLEEMFQAFKENDAQYVMPADISLFDNGVSSNKTLMFRAVKKHYPELLPKYEKLFATQNHLPDYYRKAFYEKMSELSQKYQIPNRIIAVE